MRKLLLTNKEVANSLSIDEATVDELIQNKTFDTVEIKPGVIRIKAKSVKEYTNQGNLANPRKSFFIYWLIALFSFITQIALMAIQDSQKNYLASKLVVSLLFINVGLGVIFFLIALVSKDVKKFQKEIPSIYSKTWALALVYFLIITIPTVIDVYAYQKPEIKTLNQTPTNIPSPIATIKPKAQVSANTGNTGSQIDCIGPDGKQFKTSMDECKKLNETWGKKVDYMTNCTYSDQCVGGGGTRYVKKSECDKPCTKISTGTNNTQITNPTTNTSKKTAVYITSWNTTYYCPAELVDGLKTADAQYKIAKNTKTDCTNKAFSIKSSCHTKCINDYYPDQAKMDSCLASCDSIYNNSQASCDLSYKYVEDGFMGALKGCTSFNF